MSAPPFNMFPNYFLKILKVCGVFPSNFNGGKVNVSCTLLCLTTCLIVQLLSVPAVQYFENFHEHSLIEVVTSDRGNILTKFVKCFYPIIMTTTPTVAVLNNLWLGKTHLPLYLENLCKNDAILNNNKRLTKIQDMFSNKFIACCLGISLPIKVLSITSLIVLHDVDSYVILFWVIALYFVDTVGFLAEIQFIILCNSLRIRFQEINNKLKSVFLLHDLRLEYRMRDFVTKWNKNSGRVFGTPAKGIIKKHCGRKILFSNKSKKTEPIFVTPWERMDFNYTIGDYLNKEFASTVNKNFEIHAVDFSSELNNLRLSYRYLSHALSHLKCMFEYVLLASVFTSFLLILLNAYFVIYGFVKIFILSNRVDVFFWILKSMCRFSGVLIVCDLTGKQVSELTKLICFKIILVVQ